MYRDYSVGTIHGTNCGIDVQIVQTEGLGSSSAIKIKWLDEFGYEMVITKRRLYSRKLQNPYLRAFQGVGYIGVGEYPTSVNGLTTKEFSTWGSLFNRSYSEKYISKKPTYSACSVDDRWHNFQNFAAWTVNQVGWGLEDWQIDKDLLLKGNKVYGPDTCVMLPRKLNMLTVLRSSARGTTPIGVFINPTPSMYTGQFKDLSGRKYSKNFPQVEDAFHFYKTGKEVVLKEAAELYKELIDPKAYQALLAWEVSIED